MVFTCQSAGPRHKALVWRGADQLTDPRQIKSPSAASSRGSRKAPAEPEAEPLKTPTPAVPPRAPYV